ncbi:hypothetical protein [Reyranella sp.]|uniref:hypothetical protein n=1 Tax=Reyranella sp. TaxID=1929291 RepID=UPI0027321B78|nr:hypothetical protein [Reyranella sp.]MDP2378564.1 hypothetical protein [Reyranella sp.]
MNGVVDLPGPRLEMLRSEVRAASWFAALGEPLSEGDRSDAAAYGASLGFAAIEIGQARDWPHAECLLKAPDWTPAWWDREEALRRTALATAEARYPERALWSSLTELTTEAGDLVHGKAATAAARLGNAAVASIHVAAGAASQAVLQLAVARLAQDAASPFESKFRLFAAGRWPLGILGSRLVVF